LRTGVWIRIARVYVNLKNHGKSRRVLVFACGAWHGGQTVKTGENMAPRNKKKPLWVVEKEKHRKGAGPENLWLFGIHAVRDALRNPKREKLRLVVTKNAHDKLAEDIAASGMTPELVEPRKFNVPLDAQSVHQGAAIEVMPLLWGSVSEICATKGDAPLVLLLDRVTDPHNVGAILRSAEVFGARAVIAPLRHSAPETGALAKTASGALERQPYLRIQNLSNAMKALKEMGYFLIGLDGTAEETLPQVLDKLPPVATALVLGAEGPGLRHLTKENCHTLAKIRFAGAFGSLNVSNAAAVGLYEVARRQPE
jgi:23S rRNA (guanosine2251-2'-O)-methyltransferase